MKETKSEEVFNNQIKTDRDTLEGTKSESELKELLDNPRTGLKDSSDTNKTRYAILALFEEQRQKDRESLVEMVRGMEQDTSKYDTFDKKTKEKGYKGKGQCRECMQYRDIKESSYNQALADLEQAINKIMK